MKGLNADLSHRADLSAYWREAYDRKEHLHRGIMMVKNVNVQNSDNMLADLFVCATSSSSVEGNVRVHMLVCAPLSSFDASKTLANWQCGRHSCKGTTGQR